MLPVLGLLPLCDKLLQPHFVNSGLEVSHPCQSNTLQYPSLIAPWDHDTHPSIMLFCCLKARSNGCSGQQG